MKLPRRWLTPASGPDGLRFGLWLLFGFALTWKAAIVLGSGHAALELVGEVPQTGRNLAEYGLFGNPFRIPTGPTAHVAPVCASVIGFVYWMTATAAQAQIALVALGVVCAALSWVGAASFAASQGMSNRAALLGAGLGAAFPFEYRAEATFSEAAVVPPLMMAMAALGIRLWKHGWGSAPRQAAEGVAWGAVLLVQPAMATILAGSMAWGLYRHPGRRALAGLIWSGIAMAVVLAPWTWRNYEQFGKLFLVRDNLGLELFISNNDLAGPHTGDNNPEVTRLLHPNRNADECRKLASEGEAHYNTRKLAEAKAWISGHGPAFARLTARRFVYFWIPKRGNPPGWVAETAVLLIGLTGLLLWTREYPREPALFVWMMLALYPLIYYAIQADERYAYPLRWVLFLGCGWLADKAMGGNWSKERETRDCK